MELTLVAADGDQVTLKSVKAGTSESQRVPPDSGLGRRNDLFVLPSRRMFSPSFGKGRAARESYMQNQGFPAVRTSQLDAFTSRLFTIAESDETQKEFDKVLRLVIDPVPSWTIDQEDNGNYFLKLAKGTAHHSSEGMGEGLISLLFIIDALYDSKPGDCIVVDEPELSLHPALQRRLAQVIAQYAKDRQIVVATHSPYMVNIEALKDGGTIARVSVVEHVSTVSQLREPTAKEMVRLVEDANNPHVFGLNAQEVFFLDDHIVLVEGQEDVVFYKKVQQSLGLNIKGSFFGWGVGGADKMRTVAGVLHDLGFLHVVGLLDADKEGVGAALSEQFPAYRFFCIPAGDVRTKRERKAAAPVAGLLDDANEKVRPEYEAQTRRIIEDCNAYLTGAKQAP